MKDEASSSPRKLLTGNPAMARKPGRDVVDLALYEDDPEYRAMIDARYAALINTANCEKRQG